MASKMSVPELIQSSYPYLMSAMVQFPNANANAAFEPKPLELEKTTATTVCQT